MEIAVVELSPIYVFVLRHRYGILQFNSHFCQDKIESNIFNFKRTIGKKTRI